MHKHYVEFQVWNTREERPATPEEIHQGLHLTVRDDERFYTVVSVESSNPDLTLFVPE